MVIAKVGDDGQISINNQFGGTNIIVDVVGWFPSDVGFSPVVPARLMDTRAGQATVDGQASGGGAFGGGQTRTLTVVGRGGVPLTGVGAVALNVTVTGPVGNGFLTVYPSSVALPTASNVNFTTGQTIPNMVIVQVGTDGKISLTDQFGAANVVVDVVGWFP